MKRRLGTAAAIALVTPLLFAASASAASPTLGAVSATNLQGVSALLKGPVNPQGLATTYYFEYSTAANFSGSVKTTSAPAGSGSADYPARAAISGLAPDTTYHYRLVATNSSGTAQTDGTATFTTTHGFGFLSGTNGFAASAYADGGAAATQADSHPYQLDFTVGLNQGGAFEDQPGDVFADGDLRDLKIEMPPGLIVNPAVLAKCTLEQFHTPRSSPFETSLSGESCPDKSQVGTVELQTSLGGGQTRRFGLFNLDPAPGRPAQLGFAPFGQPIVFDAGLRPNADGSYVLTLDATNVPQSLDFYGLKLSLWGTPWGASHNTERGNCLNEAHPDFPWCKASVGEPAANPPLAYLTLPPACAGSLSFSASADSWQQPKEVGATAINRTSGGVEADMGGCNSLVFAPKPVGQLNDTKASSPSGYNFQLGVDEANLTDPGQFAPPPTRKAVVSLPSGVTVNPSVGAGLGVCTPAQLRTGDRHLESGRRLPQRLEDRRLLGDHAALLGHLRWVDLPCPARRPGDLDTGSREPLRHPGRGLPRRPPPRPRRPRQARRQNRPRPEHRHPHRDLRRPPRAPLHQPQPHLQDRPARLLDHPARLRPRHLQNRDVPLGGGDRQPTPPPPSPPPRSKPGSAAVPARAARLPSTPESSPEVSTPTSTPIPPTSST